LATATAAAMRTATKPATGGTRVAALNTYLTEPEVPEAEIHWPEVTPVSWQVPAADEVQPEQMVKLCPDMYSIEL